MEQYIPVNSHNKCLKESRVTIYGGLLWDLFATDNLYLCCLLSVIYFYLQFFYDQLMDDTYDMTDTDFCFSLFVNFAWMIKPN